MLKREDYLKILKEKPWEKLKETIKNNPRPNVKKQFKIAVDFKEVIQFTIDNIQDAQEITYNYRAGHNSLETDTEYLNFLCGRRDDNMSSLNWGVHGDSHTNAIKLLGKKNIERLNLNPNYLLVRYKVKLAGNGTSWHMDFLNTFQKKYPNLKIDFKTATCEHGKLIRYFIPINPWEDGHVIQIGETIITKWQPGDVYVIPWGVFHCAYNFGYVPNYTLNITGILNG